MPLARQRLHIRFACRHKRDTKAQKACCWHCSFCQPACSWHCSFCQPHAVIGMKTKHKKLDKSRLTILATLIPIHTPEAHNVEHKVLQCCHVGARPSDQSSSTSFTKTAYRHASATQDARYPHNACRAMCCAMCCAVLCGVCCAVSCVLLTYLTYLYISLGEFGLDLAQILGKLFRGIPSGGCF